MLFLELVATAVVIVPSALFIGYLLMRRRQLAKAQAYAQVRALRALGQRMATESGPISQRYNAMVQDEHAQRRTFPGASAK